MENPEKATSPNFNPFWPLLLLAAALIVFLGWNVVQGARQYVTGLRIGDQQSAVAIQAAQAEEKLRAMMIDLLALAKTDTDARAIAAKYQINFTPNGQQPGVQQQPTPASDPKDKKPSE